MLPPKEQRRLSQVGVVNESRNPGWYADDMQRPERPTLRIQQLSVGLLREIKIVIAAPDECADPMPAGQRARVSDRCSGPKGVAIRVCLFSIVDPPHGEL